MRQVKCVRQVERVRIVQRSAGKRTKAGINLKIWSDRLPEAEQQNKSLMMREASQFCEVARREQPPRTPRQAPTWNDRFFYIHCCETYETLGLLDRKAECNAEGVARGLWKHVNQRPGR